MKLLPKEMDPWKRICNGKLFWTILTVDLNKDLIVCICCLLILFPVPVSSAPALRHHQHQQQQYRWQAPCAGSNQLLEDIYIDLETTTPSHHDMKSSIKAVAEKTHKLNKKVSRLKRDYVKFRFLDEGIGEDLDLMDFQLDGMPKSKRHNIKTKHVRNQVISILQQTIEDMSRVAVYLDKAEHGEKHSEQGAVSFVKEFREIASHHEHGFYWILCELHRTVQNQGEKIRPKTINEIKKIKPGEASTRAIRHWRDYIVLRDLERLLTKIGDDMTRLHNALSSLQS